MNQWRRALRRFKQGVRLRARFGVVQSLCEKVAAERANTPLWTRPDWGDDAWLDYLCFCIRNNQYPLELLEGFVRTAEVTLLTPKLQPTPDKVLAAVDYVCSRYGKQLREKFGVNHESK